MDRVGPGHGAAPECVDAYLILLPAAAVPLPAIHRPQAVLGIDSFQQQLCGAAGGVDLLVVVSLDNLAVKAGQLTRGLGH